MKWLSEWFATILLLVIIVILWLILSILRSPLLLITTIMPYFTEQSTILGKVVIWKAWRRSMIIADDQNINATLGGDRDITISSRVGKRAIEGNGVALKMEKVINLLFVLLFKQENHCRISIERDETHHKNWGG